MHVPRALHNSGCPRSLQLPRTGIPLHPHPATRQGASQGHCDPLLHPGPIGMYAFRGYSTQFRHKREPVQSTDIPVKHAPRSTLVRLADIEALCERAKEGRMVRRGSTFSSGRIMKEDHTIKWEDAEMMKHSQWYRQRCTMSAWHIRSEKRRMTEMKALFQLCITLLSTYHTQTHTTDGMFLPTSIDSSKRHAHFITFYNSQLYFVRGLLLSSHTIIISQQTHSLPPFFTSSRVPQR